jgi:small-conductance mechanosensitive channel
MSEVLDKVISYVFITVLILYAIKVLVGVIKFFTDEFIKTKKEKEERVNKSFIDFFRNIIIGIVWVLGLVIILSNLGFNVTALITGLGIGGIAIALAIQNILSDLLSSISIFLDKPFEEGDFIIVDNDLGTIKKIGIKSTRISTLQGEELVISNKELVEKRIHNYKKLSRRRIVFSIGLTYNTKLDKLKQAVNIIKEIINSIELADLDRVHFSKFGDFSLIFDIVYYVNIGDYNKYMDTQQEINFKIKQEFEKQGIEMAFPTQTIYLEKK